MHTFCCLLFRFFRFCIKSNNTFCVVHVIFCCFAVLSFISCPIVFPMDFFNTCSVDWCTRLSGAVSSLVVFHYTAPPTILYYSRAEGTAHSWDLVRGGRVSQILLGSIFRDHALGCHRLYSYDLGTFTIWQRCLRLVLSFVIFSEVYFIWSAWLYDRRFSRQTSARVSYSAASLTVEVRNSINARDALKIIICLVFAEYHDLLRVFWRIVYMKIEVFTLLYGDLFYTWSGYTNVLMCALLFICRFHAAP